ncbi:MAG TPA: hypothetical protein VJ549_02645, partial [Geothrix sp.]|nr:hypothetical protein [Geothrix sp.]
MAVIDASETTVNSVGAPLKVTAVAPLKPVPVRVTRVPTGPLVGLSAVTVGVGMTVNEVLVLPVPPGVVTETLPVVAPAGTVAVTDRSEITVNEAGVPLKVTAEAPLKPVPARVTTVPIGPVLGFSAVTVGAGMTVNEVLVLPVPPGVVTETLPVVAPAGTVAV